MTDSSVFEHREALNHRQMYAFIGALTGLAAIFIFFHLGRRVAQKSNIGKKGVSALAAISRKPRNVLLRTAPGLPSRGHAILVFFYLAINIIVTFTDIDNSVISMSPNLASRTGWMTIANLIVLIFLALKNTPLAFLTAWSYERLNILHQIAGTMCIIFVIIHASCYSSYFGSAGRLEVLREESVIYGEIAGLSFFIIGFAGVVIRRWWYELFYYIHISFWVLAIVMTGLHQPHFGEKIIYVTIVAGGIWVLDRLIRFCRLLIYSANNSAVLTPLPNGGTRVTLKKAPLGAVSGQHCFLWIPSIRTCETHPFTIASMDPLEFVVSSHDGFTQSLHQYALKHPGATVKASVEGSYGTLPDASEYERVVLVAGGSGSTFTFGMALNMLKNLSSSQQDKKITFIWMVKYESHLTWFASHLDTLAKDARVQLQLYVTRSSEAKVDEALPQSIPTTASSETDLEKSLEKDLEKGLDNATVQSLGSADPTSSEESISDETDSAQNPSHAEAQSHAYKSFIKHGKPDVAALIKTTIDETPVENRVLVLGCGPDGLMTQVRNTTAACIRSDGPGIELHTEQFGW
ncbi:ferric reductase like transmembrane component [Trichoderma arundinaceum]|uniref:Ferric reductase like transmembrane component n=1 Tax=Trichoderma arundinaceum TaxID=490622 RepID=A0A395NPS5_TRIAR|nr:ferric reductase like transmembrane component [Trichoderma arundinaceum]